VAVERLEGVREANFSFERSEGFVTFDGTVTSAEEIVAELHRMTGYSGTVREVMTPEGK
jgi:copper chaperone CopZ